LLTKWQWRILREHCGRYYYLSGLEISMIALSMIHKSPVHHYGGNMWWASILIPCALLAGFLTTLYVGDE